MDKQKITYRQEMANYTRDLILDTAINLFLLKGCDNVTVTDIVNMAGISRGGFYVHFKNKDDIFGAILFDLDEQYKDYYENILLKNDEFINKTSLNVLECFILNVNKIISNYGADITSHFYSYAIRNPDIFTRENRHYFKIVDKLVNQCRKENLLNNLYTNSQIKEILLILNRGILIEWALNKGSYLIEEKDTIISNFFKERMTNEARMKLEG